MATRAEEWNMSAPSEDVPRYGQLAAALSKAQCEMQNPGFDSTNPHFKNKFASLAAVRNAVVPILAKHGISVSQDLASAEGGVSCTTILTHASGQQMKFGPLILPVSKNDAQGFGSAATYARRYSLMAVACVVGDDDDDAQAAVGSPQNGHADQPKPATKALVRDSVQDAANKMHAALHEGDLEEQIRQLRVLDLHEELNRNQELYQEAGVLLSASDRAAFKTYVSLAKAAEKADKAASGKRF